MILVGTSTIICLQVVSTLILRLIFNDRVSAPYPPGQLGMAVQIILGLLFGPSPETMVFQWMPIKVAMRLKVPSTVAITVLTLLFGAAHGLNRWIVTLTCRRSARSGLRPCEPLCVWKRVVNDIPDACSIQ